MTDTEYDKLSWYPKTKIEKQPKGTEMATRATLGGRKITLASFHKIRTSMKKTVDAVRDGRCITFFSPPVCWLREPEFDQRLISIPAYLLRPVLADTHPPSSPPFRATIFPRWCKKIGHVCVWGNTEAGQGRQQSHASKDPSETSGIKSGKWK